MGETFIVVDMLLYTRGRTDINFTEGTTCCGLILDTRSIVVRTRTGRHSLKLKWHIEGRGNDKITLNRSNQRFKFTCKR